MNDYIISSELKFRTIYTYINKYKLFKEEKGLNQKLRDEYLT